MRDHTIRGMTMATGSGSQHRATPEQDGGLQAIAARSGEPFTIHLWEDRTRGEQWVPSYDPTALALVNDDFLRIASNNAVDTGQRSFEFLAVREGTHRLVFEKRMGWKFTAEDRREFVIETQASPLHDVGA